MSDTTPQKRTLRELREERGMSREELAVALDIPFPTLVNLEMRRNSPRIELAERIYAFFGVPLGSIDWTRQPRTARARKTTPAPKSKAA